MKHKLTWTLFFSLAIQASLILFSAPFASGETPRRPRTAHCVAPGGAGGCFATVQSAIDASGYGDLINVAAGTYDEHVIMKNGVSVYGAGWSNTIINGGHATISPTVSFLGGIDATTVLSGVQVTGGGNFNPATSFPGSGIYIVNSSPTIMNTWVYSCTGYYGGGVSVMSGSPSFVNVPVWNSRALYGGGLYLGGGGQIAITGNPLELSNGTVLFNSSENDGGGVLITGVTATITGMRFYGNSTGTGFKGGGVAIDNTTQTVMILLSDMSGNSAGYGGGLSAEDSTNVQVIASTLGNRVPLVGGNAATHQGGGVYLHRSSGLFQLNSFLDNSNGPPGVGGGASVTGVGEWTFSGNRFEGNLASLYGGGIAVETGSTVRLDANTIVGNSTQVGGGVYVDHAVAVTLTNNIIARNVATLINPGGVALGETTAWLMNNTIADNQIAGIVFYTSSVTIGNNIVYQNGHTGIKGVGTGAYIVDYNDVYGQAVPYSGVIPGVKGQNVDPLFVGSGSDLFVFYHLQKTSPVRANGYVLWAPWNDIDGQARKLCGTVSIGADEIPCEKLFLPLIMR